MSKNQSDPVDIATGQFVYTKTDLALPDILPIALTRTYIANDSRSRSFGIGATDSYDILMVGDTNPYTYQELVLPDGARIRFDRVSTRNELPRRCLCPHQFQRAVLRRGDYQTQSGLAGC